MVRKKKAEKIDVGSNSGLGYSVGEEADEAKLPTHATPDYKPGHERKHLFDEDM